MKKAEETRVERVCVALDAAYCGTETLSVAASLAQELGAELTGFFLEDVNVLRAAALSFTCELGLASGRARPMQVEGVERAFRAQGHALKSALARAAEELQLRWSFMTVRGAGLSPVLAAATETSLMVFPPRSFSPVARTRADRHSYARPELHKRCIAVIYDDRAEALDVVRLAALIAHSRSAPLMVIHEDRSASDVERYLRARLATDARVASYIAIDGMSVENTAAASREARAVLLLAPFHVVFGLDLTDLLHRLACPLVLLK